VARRSRRRNHSARKLLKPRSSPWKRSGRNSAPAAPRLGEDLATVSKGASRSAKDHLEALEEGQARSLGPAGTYAGRLCAHLFELSSASTRRRVLEALQSPDSRAVFEDPIPKITIIDDEAQKTSSPGLDDIVIVVFLLLAYGARIT